MRTKVLAFALLALALSHSPIAKATDLDLSGYNSSGAERMQQWRDGLLSFAAGKSDLTRDQAVAIQNLADLSDPSLFARSLDTVNRSFLLDRLDELGRVLPHAQYLALLRSFGDLRLWLIDNQLATRQVVDVPICNCHTGGGDCTSAICQDVTCVHQQGTTHNGVCKGSAILME